MVLEAGGDVGWRGVCEVLSVEDGGVVVVVVVEEEAGGGGEEVDIATSLFPLLIPLPP